MQKRRIVAALLSAAMLLTAAPFTAFAANADSASNGVAVNKTASTLQNRESTVTLTVGAPDGSSTVVGNDPIAIEFVVDATRSLFYVDKDDKTLTDAMAAALTQLADKNVYVGLTVFTSTAQEIVEPTKLTSANLSEVDGTITKVKNYTNILSSPVGTNIEAGIKTADSALDKLTAVDAEDKYVVLVTDGGAYWWNDDQGKPVSQTFGSGTPTGNTDVVEGGCTLGSFSATASIDRTAGNYTTGSWKTGSYVSNLEKGTFFAWQAAKALDANLITVDFPYYDGEIARYASEFIEALPGAKIAGAGKSYSAIFSEVLREICVIPSGTITDVIGKGTDSKYQQYNFDIKAGSKVTLTVGGKSETKAFANSISFFDGKYVFTYHSGDNEYFTLDIKEPILPSAPLKLSYTVDLADRGSKDGSHSELYTNVEATLDTPVGKSTFPRPEVSYRINGDNSGGSSGGTIDIEEPQVPQGLNGDNHFQYVMGYTDGTVRPLAKITRAEVAAIFYRLLDDETRERYFTTENDFPDMKDTMWYNKAVSTLSNAGIITGCSDGLFHGSRNITRAELATIIAKFDDHVYEGRDYFNDISTHWARTFINSSADNGWIVGDGSGKFRPYDDITRAEVMTMINAVLNRAVDEDGLCDGYKKWPDNPKTAWYYYQVIEATNYHDYEREADMTEDWIEILPDKVWNEAGVD